MALTEGVQQTSVQLYLELLHEKSVSNTFQYRYTMLRALWYKGDLAGAISFLSDQKHSALTRLELVRQTNLLQTDYYLDSDKFNVISAQETLENIEVWALENEDASESVRGIMAIAAALAGDRELLHQIRAETLEDVEGESDVISNNITLVELATALALSGDTDGAWKELKALLNQPSGVSSWDLKLHPGYKVWFEDIPEYQQITN